MCAAHLLLTANITSYPLVNFKTNRYSLRSIQRAKEYASSSRGLEKIYVCPKHIFLLSLGLEGPIILEPPGTCCTVEKQVPSQFRNVGIKINIPTLRYFSIWPSPAYHIKWYGTYLGLEHKNCLVQIAGISTSARHNHTVEKKFWVKLPPWKGLLFEEKNQMCVWLLGKYVPKDWSWGYVRTQQSNISLHLVPWWLDWSDMHKEGLKEGFVFADTGSFIYFSFLFELLPVNYFTE